MTEREVIENLHQKYLSLRENTPELQRDGAECRAYHEWYESAYVYFKSLEYLQDDSDFQTFVNAEKEGNCFVLAHIYDSISPSYKVLMLKTGSKAKSDKKVVLAKKPMVFISHSSKDKDFAEALVVLLEDLGFDSSNLFCSSVDGYGISLSEDIFDTLMNLFTEHDLFVIFIHSPRYYKSPISLNEMGAAWVLKTGFCSFLTTDMEYGMMKGVVNNHTISIKVDSDDAPARLTELKDNLAELFRLNPINSIKWERKRQDFLNKVLSLKYKVEVEGTEIKNDLSNDERQILTDWVKSGNPYSIEQNFMGNRRVFYLGNKGYEAIGAEAHAEWDDFFERLVSYGLIDYVGTDKNGHPKYKLKKAAFDYVKANELVDNNK